MSHIRLEQGPEGIDVDVCCDNHELVIMLCTLIDNIKVNMSMSEQAALIGTLAQTMFGDETEMMLAHLILAVKNRD